MSDIAGIINFELPVANATVGTPLIYRWHTWKDVYTIYTEWLAAEEKNEKATSCGHV